MSNFQPSFHLPIRDLKRTKPLLLPKQRQGRGRGRGGGPNFPLLDVHSDVYFHFLSKSAIPSHTLAAQPIQVLTPSQHKGLDNSKTLVTTHTYLPLCACSTSTALVDCQSKTIKKAETLHYNSPTSAGKEGGEMRFSTHGCLIGSVLPFPVETLQYAPTDLLLSHSKP